MNYNEYLASPHWQETRKRKLKSVGFRCERCSTRAEVLDCHHLHYKSLHVEELEDLEVLCRPCHAEEHGICPLQDWDRKIQDFLAGK